MSFGSGTKVSLHLIIDYGIWFTAHSFSALKRPGLYFRRSILHDSKSIISHVVGDWIVFCVGDAYG